MQISGDLCFHLNDYKTYSASTSTLFNYNHWYNQTFNSFKYELIKLSTCYESTIIKYSNEQSKAFYM